MARAEQRKIDWGSAEVEDATLTVALSGLNAKAWRQRFQSVQALLETAHSDWGEVSLGKHGLRVAEVQRGAETELRHFLESVILQVNSELPESRATDDDPDRVDDDARADREMTSAFRAFADD